MAPYKMGVFTMFFTMLVDYTAYGCSCAPLGDLCDYIKGANAVIRGTAVSTSGQQKGPTAVSYTVDTLQLIYKAGALAGYPQAITFTTAGSTAACGVVLEEHKEYLIGLYGDDSEEFTLNSCGLFRRWEDVTEKEQWLLEEGCFEDGCNGTCDEKTQACIYHEEEHRCADITCDPSPCADNESCNLEKWDCVQEPCPVIAVCRDACNGGCEKPQECVYYPDKGFTCASQTCDPSPCADHETCVFQKSLPPVVTCVDNCDGECDDSQVCRQYKEKWYCSDTCSGMPCESGEKCVTRESEWCRNSGFDGCPEKRRCLA